MFKTYESVLTREEADIVYSEVTASPTSSPTGYPTVSPTVAPSDAPSTQPSAYPTSSPTVSPTVLPSVSPTESPTVSPTMSPTESPTVSPTIGPSEAPTESSSTFDSADSDFDTGAAATSVDARPWAMSFFAGFVPLGMFSLFQLRTIEPTNTINRLPHYTLVLISIMSLVYCTVFSYDTEDGSFTDAMAALTIVLLELGFLLETLLISKYTHFPYFSWIPSSHELLKLSVPALYSMALLSLSAIAAFVVAFSTSGNALGYAAVVFLVIAEAPTALLCWFAGIAYRSTTTKESNANPFALLAVCLSIALFQVIAVSSWTVMAFKDESLDSMVALFLTSELITCCMFLVAFQGVPATTTQANQSTPKKEKEDNSSGIVVVETLSEDTHGSALNTSGAH